MRVRSWPGLALAWPLWPGSTEGQGQGQPDCGPALEGQGQVRKNWAGPGPDRTSDSLSHTPPGEPISPQPPPDTSGTQPPPSVTPTKPKTPIADRISAQIIKIHNSGLHTPHTPPDEPISPEPPPNASGTHPPPSATSTKPKMPIANRIFAQTIEIRNLGLPTLKSFSTVATRMPPYLKGEFRLGPG